jgi:hypothetical protein
MSSHEPHPFWGHLSDLKRLEFDVNALLAMTDIDVRMIAVWPKVTRTILGSPFENKYVHEAWNYVDFYAGEWARMANIDDSIVWDRWKSLANSRMIYPDGTYHEKVRDAIKTRVDVISKLK